MRIVLQKIKRLISEGEKFNINNSCYPHRNYPRDFCGGEKPEWTAWIIRSYNAIEKYSSSNSPAKELADTATAIQTEGNYLDRFERKKITMIKALTLLQDSIKKDYFGELKKSQPKSLPSVFTNKIFVVHGHDHAFKTEVETFLKSIGLEPVVLHKEPDEGQTIIEKFEKHSDVGYAFILLTPDEIAYTVNQEEVEDSKRKKEKRTRQNVIFEFGYFAGRLGRQRVCCLYKGDVKLPSDLEGLLYKKIDGGVEAKGYEIIKELRAAGYKIQI